MQDSNLTPEPLDTPQYRVNNNPQDGRFEVIDRRQLIPYNDTECQHPTYLEDHSDETDTYIAMVCSNPKCPVGYLQSK